MALGTAAVFQDLNRIKFVVQASKHGDLGVRIFVDHVDLVELARVAELPFARAEGTPSLAGEYSGLPPEEVLPPSRHFLGGPLSVFRYGDRIQLLGCECGEPGCWPLTCRIDLTASTVRWSDFCQPYRAKPGAGAREPWRYDALGPFVFDRTQYETALQTARELPVR